VKQYHDRDLGVIVTLKGPLLPYPEIEFKSDAEYTISETDLLSYLLTGRRGGSTWARTMTRGRRYWR
jgi:hypothetical protein